MREKISMRKIKEVLRLRFECNLSQRGASKVCKVGRKTIQDYERRFKVSELTWPLADDVTEEVLEQKLFGTQPRKVSNKSPIDFEHMFQELKKPNVTLEVLWEEYRKDNSNGYQYSHFCNLFRVYLKSMNYSMRQEHKAGEKTFVDFGTGLKLFDTKTNSYIPTQLFVSVWGASNKTFAQATLGEDLASWIEVNSDALESFGCCPKVIVPDNLKSAVTKACRYEPKINQTYAEFGEHHGTVIYPARPYRPKDKSKAENGVKLCKRWVLSRLRNEIFTSLADMNEAIAKLTERLNNKPLSKIKKSRNELFETLDRPNALALPSQRYEFAEWKLVKVHIDYHVSFDEHHYSVPYTLIHQELEVRATAKTIEVYRKGVRMCSHRRDYQKHGYTTVKEHMPPSHQKYLEWTPQRILEWAKKYGASVKTLVEQIMSQRKFHEQAYRSCLGIIRLVDHYSAPRLDAACERALKFKIHSYQGVKIILEKGLDKIESIISNPAQSQSVLIEHENIRGAKYFHGKEDVPIEKNSAPASTTVAVSAVAEVLIPAMVSI